MLGAERRKSACFLNVLPSHTNAVIMRRNEMKDHYDFSEALRGPVVTASGKTRITLFVDSDVLDSFLHVLLKQAKAIRR